MSFRLKIITPEHVVYEGSVASVVLPTATGEIEILEHHLPMIGVLEAGTVFYTETNTAVPMAVDTGFFKLADNELLLLTEAAIDVQSVDEASIDAAVRRAEEALEKAKHEKQIDEEELERLDKLLRFSVAQKLTKQAKRS